jgi:hypothetical protein
MIESAAAFVVGAVLAGLALFAGVNNMASAELPASEYKSQLAVYDG